MFCEWVTMLRLRLWSLVKRRRLEKDLDDEIRFHLAQREESLRTSGLAASDAGPAARRRFGNTTRVKEASRDLWTFPGLESVWHDLRYGARVLLRNKIFAAAGLLSLALGIGANTAVFTLINAVMLEKLPVAAPDELAILNWRGRARDLSMTNAAGSRAGTNNVFSYPAFEQFRARSSQLRSVFAFTPMRRAAVALPDRIEMAQGLLVSGGFYQGMGVQPFLGRLLNEEDDRRGAGPVAVLSYRFWETSFHSDPRAVGSSVTVNGIPVVVAGVTPAAFYGPSAGSPVPSPDVTLALAMQPEVETDLGRGELFFAPRSWWLNVMGRLRPGATLQSAEAELNGIFRQVNAAADAGDPRLVALSGARGLENARAFYKAPLTVLLVAGCLVLLLACTNLATLMLARATARNGEIAVRLAIGAGRMRIVRQLLTESLLLSLSAGVLGAALSWWGSRALLRWLVSDSETFPLSLAPDWRVAGFLAAISAAAGMLFGLAPAFRASRGVSPDRGIHAGRLGQGLIVVQVALSVVIIVGAGLFVRTLRNLRNVNLGFRSEGILLFRVDPALNRYEGDRLLRFHRELLASLRHAPGALSVTSTRIRLLTGGMSGSPAQIPGAASSPQVHINDVGPGFFETMGIPLLLGRGVNERDTASAPQVAVVNEAFVREAFPGEPPLGKTFYLFGGWGPYQVVGVAADAHYAQLRVPPPPTAYIPYEQSRIAVRGMNIAVRTAGPPEAFLGAARSIVRRLDPNIPLTEVRTQRRVIDEALRSERLFANLASWFGALALLLAAIGSYGVVAYAAARRTGEIGVRMALGARFSHIVWMMLRSTALLAALGIACGVAGAKALTKLIESALFGVEPGDPVTFIAGGAILFLTALVAGFLPARRAARIQPMAALRCE